MAMTKSGWFLNSLILNFITQPFRLLLICSLIICVVFGSSIVAQSSFDGAKKLPDELQMLNQLEQQQAWLSWDGATDREQNNQLPHAVTKTVYAALHWTFFEATQIDRSLIATEKTDFGYQLKQRFLMPHIELLRKFDVTLKIISLRCGYLAYFALFAIILIAIGAIDGFTARKIRQQNGSRESAGIYHRAKYWRSGVLWLCMIAYLAMPIEIPADILLIPCVIYSLLVWLQAKYLKKYL